MRIAEWLVGGAVLVVGIVLAGFAMFGMGVALLWSGYGSTGEGARSWWLWPLFLAPPVLMVLGGFLVRRAGASIPLALGGAGAIGALVGVAYLLTAYLSGR
ncbi:MAG: hypothetical protein ACRDT6_07830 [Micromonosporaceae bacterium]